MGIWWEYWHWLAVTGTWLSYFPIQLRIIILKLTNSYISDFRGGETTNQTTGFSFDGFWVEQKWEGKGPWNVFWWLSACDGSALGLPKHRDIWNRLKLIETRRLMVWCVCSWVCQNIFQACAVIAFLISYFWSLLDLERIRVWVGSKDRAMFWGSFP